MILSVFNGRKRRKKLTPRMIEDFAENASVFESEIHL